MTGRVELEISAPLVAESLDGFVARVAADTGILKVRDVSGAGGVVYGHRPQLATTGWNELPALAEVLQVDVAQLHIRAHPLSADGTRRAFFGTSVPREMLSTRVRRFSPSALAASGHHRALWQLRLPFDIETGEVLVGRCPDPECATVQRWRQTSGIRFCDVCATDLATAPTTKIPPEELDDAAAAIGLIHPDPAKRSTSRAMLPARFRDEDPGMVLDLVLRLMPVALPACRWSHRDRWWDADPHIVARALAGAWRLMPGFPHSVRDHMSRAMVENDRRFSDGNEGASIHFLKLRERAWISPVARSAATELHDLMNLNGPNSQTLLEQTIGLKEVCRATGIKTGVMVPLRRRGAVATIAVMRDSVIVPNYDRPEIEGIVAAMRDRRELKGGTEAFGIPFYGLEQMVAMGRLNLLAHRFFEMHYGCPQTTLAELGRVAGLIAAQRVPVVVGAIPLPTAVRAIGGRLKPWGPIVEALIGGRLPFELADGDTPLAERIRVAPADLHEVAAAGFDPDRDVAPHLRPFAFSTHMTKRDAGEVLNIGPREHTALFAHLPTSSTAQVEIVALLELAVGTVALTELAARTGLHIRTVLARAAKAGIERCSLAGYPRIALEQLLLGSDIRNDEGAGGMGANKAA